WRATPRRSSGRRHVEPDVPLHTAARDSRGGLPANVGAAGRDRPPTDDRGDDCVAARAFSTRSALRAVSMQMSCTLMDLDARPFMENPPVRIQVPATVPLCGIDAP